MGLTPQDYVWHVIDRHGRPHYYRNDDVAASVGGHPDAEMTILVFDGDPIMDETYHSATARCEVCGESWRLAGGLSEMVSGLCPACPTGAEVAITYLDYHVSRAWSDVSTQAD